MDLLKSYTDQAVHIVLSSGQMCYEQVWDTVKKYRFLMQKNLVVGRNQILFTDGNNDDGQGIQEIVKMKPNGYFKNYFLSMDLKKFSDEIQSVLRYMIHNNAAQQSIEKVSLYVLKLLEISGRDYEPEFLAEMQKNMQRGIGYSVTEEELKCYMTGYFEKIENYMERLCEKIVEQHVVEYVDNNFLAIESMEQVADVFGCNYTYLSRMFKKISGMSMNKYITKKKIKFHIDRKDEL